MWWKSRWAVLACLLCAALPVCAHPQEWQAAIAKVTVRTDLNRTPGTAFVVAIGNQTAYLVTSAHVVAGDDSPILEFRADPDHSHKAAVRNIQGSDPDHGLALLTVSNPPTSVRALAPSAAAKAPAGDSVTIAGYPNEVGSFLAPHTTIAAAKGQDLVLSLHVDEGFSGGPVLRADGSVMGLIWGHTGSFGVAMVSDLVKLYLEGNDVTWGLAKQGVPASFSCKLTGTSAPYDYTLGDDNNLTLLHHGDGEDFNDYLQLVGRGIIKETQTTRETKLTQPIHGTIFILVHMRHVFPDRVMDERLDQGKVLANDYTFIPDNLESAQGPLPQSQYWVGEGPPTEFIWTIGDINPDLSPRRGSTEEVLQHLADVKWIGDCRVTSISYK